MAKKPKAPKSPKGTYLGTDSQEAVYASKKFARYQLLGGSDYAESNGLVKNGAIFELGNGDDIFVSYNERADIVIGGAGSDHIFLTSSVTKSPEETRSTMHLFHAPTTIRDFDPVVDGGVHILYGIDVVLDSSNSTIITTDSSGVAEIIPGSNWNYNTQDRTLYYTHWKPDLSEIIDSLPVAIFEAGLDQSSLQGGKIKIHSEESWDTALNTVATNLGFTTS